jgi:hypothetical protein
MAAPTSAKALRAKGYWTLEVDPELTVELRRLDMVTLFMTGAIPMPLMASLSRAQEIRQKDGMDDATFMSELGEDDKTNMLDLLRRYACLAVKSPPLVLVDDGNPEHVPVELLTGPQLLTIWQALPPDAQTPRLTEAQADEFRGPESGQAPAPAVPDGGEVRAETIELVTPGGSAADLVGA